MVMQLVVVHPTLQPWPQATIFQKWSLFDYANYTPKNESRQYKTAVPQLPLPKQQKPPPGFTITFDGEGMFAANAPPDPEFFIVISIGTAALRAFCPQFFNSLFIHVFPVII